MKLRCTVSALLLAATALVACGSGASSKPASAVTGNWSITLNTQATNPPGTTFLPGIFIVTLVPGLCSLPTGLGAFTAIGSNCSTTDGTGGSLSGTGEFFGSPEDIVVGTSSSGQVNVLFVEASPCCGSPLVYNGNGTISNGSISGTWACASDLLLCSGFFGTFTGTKQ
jgi:hypothetical protein